MAALVTHELASFRGTAVAAFGADPKALRGYEEKLGHINIYAQRAAARIAPGQAGHGGMLCTDREVLRTEYYDGFLRPNDWFYVAGGVVAKDSELVSLVSVQRPRRKGHYTQRDLDALQLLMPHLDRATRIHSRLHKLQSGIQAIDSLSIGIVTVTAKGKVLFANEYARGILSRDDGLSLGQGGVLVAAIPQRQALALLITNASETSAGRGLHAGGALAIERPSGKASYQLLITPTRTKALAVSSERPAAIVFIGDPSQGSRPAQDLLRIFYDLTPAECRVAILLADGCALTEIAEKLGVSRNTLKSQLASIYGKTETRRQAQLVRLLLQMGAVGIDQGD